MTKKNKTEQNPRSVVRKGPLTDAEYRETVHLPITKGIVNPPRERSAPGQWEGNVFVADKPQTTFSLAAELANYEHSEKRLDIWKAIVNGQVTPEVKQEANERRLLQGPIPWKAIEAEAFAKILNKTPEGTNLGSYSKTIYESLDAQERKEHSAWSPEIEKTKQFAADRKRRLDRLRELF